MRLFKHEDDAVVFAGRRIAAACYLVCVGLSMLQFKLAPMLIPLVFG